MKKRWFIYSLIGVFFGVFDFYYQELTAGKVSSHTTWFIIAWGIWLIPITPIIIYEAKVSGSKVMSILASVLTWSISIISYYLYMAIKLIFIGQATRPELHISSYTDQFYWANLKGLFWGEVLGGITEWIAVALVGGSIIGFLVSFIYLRLREKAKVND